MAGFLQARRVVPTAAAGKNVAVLNDVQKKKKEMEKAKAEVAMKKIEKKIEDSRARRAAQLEEKKLKVQELRKNRVCVVKKTIKGQKKMEKPPKIEATEIEEKAEEASQVEQSMKGQKTEKTPKEAAAKTEAPKTEAPKEAAAEIKLGFRQGFFDEYKPFKLITKGSFGSVYKAGIINNVHQGPLFAAVKVFWKSKITEHAVKYIQKEVDVMTALNGHPNIVKFYGAYEDEKCIYIAMEFLDEGSLQDALNLRGGVCDEMEAKRWTQQIVAALEALHMQRIAHRHMKLENIMLDFKGDVKLIDFGLSDYVFPGEKLSKMAGSRGYIAPEVFDKKRGLRQTCGV